VRGALDDADPVVRQVALHSVSLHRDARAVPKLLNVLRSGSPPHRRVAAEALGRVGGPDQIGELLAVVPGVDDRELEHALIFAALEIGDADALREGLTHADPAVRRAALIALDQREASDLRSEEVVPLLSEGDESLRAAAWWVIDQHADWSASLTELFAKMLRHEQQDHGDLASRLGRFAATVPIQELLGNLLADPSLPDDARSTVLAAMALASIDHVPAAWHDGLKHELDRGAEDGVLAVLRVLRLQKPGTGMEPFLDSLQGLPGREHLPVETRLRALTVIPPAARRLDDKTLPLLCSHLTSDHPVPVRALAVDALQHVPLTRAQLLAIVDRIPHTGPMELRSLMEVFARSHDERVGLALVAALESCPAVGSLRLDDLHRQLEGFGTNVVQKADPLLQRIARENSELMQKFDRVLALIEAADVRNGQALFHSPKAACAACHTTGYLGGTIGPGLRRIGKIRSERDLLEAILLPSASFVQTFEPVTILTRDGLAYSGLIKEESPHRIVLQLDAEKTQGISVDEIEERSPGTTSIMPAGLDKQFTLQELADLVAFLKVVE
jgi:putative heme-binding domain-containing protein